MVVCRDTLSDLSVAVIELNGKNTENVHSYNYLSVIVDDMLLFDEFIDAKCNKINLRIYQMGRMCKYIILA